MKQVNKESTTDAASASFKKPKADLRNTELDVVSTRGKKRNLPPVQPRKSRTSSRRTRNQPDDSDKIKNVGFFPLSEFFTHEVSIDYAIRKTQALLKGRFGIISLKTKPLVDNQSKYAGELGNQYRLEFSPIIYEGEYMGQPVVIKMTNLNSKSLRQFQTELILYQKLLRKADRGVLLPIRCSLIEDSNSDMPTAFRIMEFSTVGNLLDLKTQLSQKVADLNLMRLLLEDLCHGLAFLHRNGIAHLNLTSENAIVFVGSFKYFRFNAKWTGFSNSRICPENTSDLKCFKPIGDLTTIAPETVLGPLPYRAMPVDIFTFGMLVLDMISDVRLMTMKYDQFVIINFSLLVKDKKMVGEEIEQRVRTDYEYQNWKIERVRHAKEFLYPKSETNLPEWVDFWSNCMNMDPSIRPTTEELLAHPYWKTEHRYKINLIT